MSFFSNYTYSLFDPWLSHKQPSVYVISDSEMKAYKQKQAEAEILELKKLIDSHKDSIERLETHVAALEKEYPQLPENTSEAA